MSHSKFNMFVYITFAYTVTETTIGILSSLLDTVTNYLPMKPLFRNQPTKNQPLSFFSKNIHYEAFFFEVA